MGILDKVVKIEKKLEKLAARKDAPVTPLEIRRAILDDIESQVQPAGRSRRVFPYNQVAIEVLAADRKRDVSAAGAAPPSLPGRAELEAVLGADALTESIRERLEEAGCERVGGLQVSVKIVGKRRTEWPPDALFRVAYDRAGAKALPAKPAGTVGARPGPEVSDVAARPTTGEAAVPRTHAQLVVLDGSATRKAYVLAGERTNIGRLAEVTDKHRRIVRRNQVVFLDVDDEANQTVSRAQAHIRYTPPDDYRLFDDNSSYGTRISRDGRMIELPSGSPRGTRLQPGDEIYLGRARVIFQVK